MKNYGPAKCITPSKNRLGEEPVWHAHTQILYWVDTINPGKIYGHHPESGNTESWEYSHPILSLALHENGNLLVADATSIWQWSPQMGLGQRIAQIETDKPDNRINCMACDPLGNLWVATMQNNVTDTGEPKDITGYFGSLYRIDKNGHVEKFGGDYACPNTMVWSPDHKFFYFGDSATGWIYRHDYDSQTGDIGERTEFFRSPNHGVPDGSDIDEEGYIWNARWGDKSVLRISPAGELAGKITLTASQPSCCVFGGVNNNTLFITSARFGMKASECSDKDGGLFALRTEHIGAKPYCFKG